MRWTGGVHRRSGENLVFLHSSESTRIPRVFGTSPTANNSIGSFCTSGETRAQCECASSPNLGLLSHSRHQPRLRAVLVTAPPCLKRDQAAFQSHSEGRSPVSVSSCRLSLVPWCPFLKEYRKLLLLPYSPLLAQQWFHVSASVHGALG